jgi:hypothetical protein
MPTQNPTVKWLALALTMALTITACGGDDSDTVGAAGSDASQEEADNGGGSEGSGSDSTSTDDGATTGQDSEGTTEPDPDPGDTGGGDDDADPAAPSGEVDCDEIDAALDSAGAVVGGDPTLFGTSPQQQFEEARATMLALREQAPDIADDIDGTLAGLEVISNAFDEIGWDTDFESDPAAAVRLVQLAFSDPAVSGMMTSVANIGSWLATNCAS